MVGHDGDGVVEPHDLTHAFDGLGQVNAMVTRALSEFGRIDILINNAVIRPHKLFTEVTVQDWEQVRSIVLDGAIYCTQAAIGSMITSTRSSCCWVSKR